MNSDNETRQSFPSDQVSVRDHKTMFGYVRLEEKNLHEHIPLSLKQMSLAKKDIIEVSKNTNVGPCFTIVNDEIVNRCAAVTKNVYGSIIVNQDNPRQLYRWIFQFNRPALHHDICIGIASSTHQILNGQISKQNGAWYHLFVSDGDVYVQSHDRRNLMDWCNDWGRSDTLQMEVNVATKTISYSVGNVIINAFDNIDLDYTYNLVIPIRVDLMSQTGFRMKLLRFDNTFSDSTDI
eukprot:582919_1